MEEAKLPRQRGANTNKPGPERPAALGQRACAEKNRELKARLRIVQALSHLSIPHAQWPDFVQSFYTDPSQRTAYHQYTGPAPFQAPRFDRLMQSDNDWAKLADSAWERHRNRFLKTFPSWVKAGVDEEIVEKRVRGPGKKPRADVHDGSRGENTPFERRYEWAARYLIRVPIKTIASAGEDVSTVGRVARSIIRSAGWSNKARTKKA